MQAEACTWTNAGLRAFVLAIGGLRFQTMSVASHARGPELSDCTSHERCQDVSGSVRVGRKVPRTLKSTKTCEANCHDKDSNVESDSRCTALWVSWSWLLL